MTGTKLFVNIFSKNDEKKEKQEFFFFTQSTLDFSVAEHYG
jgi:hypothetical protein